MDLSDHIKGILSPSSDQAAQHHRYIRAAVEKVHDKITGEDTTPEQLKGYENHPHFKAMKKALKKTNLENRSAIKDINLVKKTDSTSALAQVKLPRTGAFNEPRNIVMKIVPVEDSEATRRNVKHELSHVITHKKRPFSSLMNPQHDELVAKMVGERPDDKDKTYEQDVEDVRDNIKKMTPKQREKMLNGLIHKAGKQRDPEVSKINEELKTIRDSGKSLTPEQQKNIRYRLANLPEYKSTWKA